MRVQVATDMGVYPQAVAALVPMRPRSSSIPVHTLILATLLLLPWVVVVAPRFPAEVDRHLVLAMTHCTTGRPPRAQIRARGVVVVATVAMVATPKRRAHHRRRTSSKSANELLQCRFRR